MKLIIAGSRTITDFKIVKDAFNNFKFKEDVTEIVEGGARGVDSLARELAEKLNIPCTTMAANWYDKYDRLNRSAGYRRNVDMANYADMVLAIWDHQSKGTKHMIDIANDREMYVEVYNQNGVRTYQNKYW